MATEKKYYWIKLKTDFMTSDKVDYLMSQSNGAEYVVLYQMLCMKCINTDGLLARQIGEVIIPFDAEKIARDCKYFSVDTVKMAFQLFIQLGMIYQESNGYLRIADFENMVGSSKTDEHTKKLNAERQARFRENHKKELLLEQNSVTVTEDVTLNRNTDIRDKRLDIRYINSKSSGKPEKKTSEVTLVKNSWNDTYIKIFGVKPDSNCDTDKKKASFWSGVTEIVKKRLEKYDVNTLFSAIEYSQKEYWVVESGFLISTVLSDAVVNKVLINAPHSTKTSKINTTNNNFDKKSLDNKTGLEETEWP